MHKHADVQHNAPWVTEITIGSNLSSALLKTRGIGTAMGSGMLAPDKCSNESKYKNKVHQFSTSTQVEDACSCCPLHRQCRKLREAHYFPLVSTQHFYISAKKSRLSHVTSENLSKQFCKESYTSWSVDPQSNAPFDVLNSLAMIQPKRTLRSSQTRQLSHNLENGRCVKLRPECFSRCYQQYWIVYKYTHMHTFRELQSHPFTLELARESCAVLALRIKRKPCYEKKKRLCTHTPWDDKCWDPTFPKCTS